MTARQGNLSSLDQCAHDAAEAVIAIAMMGLAAELWCANQAWPR